MAGLRDRLFFCNQLSFKLRQGKKGVGASAAKIAKGNQGETSLL